MPAGAPPQHSPVWPLWMRPSPIPKRRFMILPKTRKSVGSHRHHVPVFHAVSVPHTGGRRPIRISRPPAIHKKPQSPHFAGHTLQPMPGCFPHASDPHTGNIPIPPQSDHAPAETSAAGSANQASAGLLKLPATATTASPPAASTYGIASRCVVGVADARGAALRLQARLGAGSASAQPVL